MTNGLVDNGPMTSRFDPVDVCDRQTDKRSHTVRRRCKIWRKRTNDKEASGRPAAV